MLKIKILARGNKTYLNLFYFRNRPFNLQGGLWFFVSFRNFFSDNTSQNFFFFPQTRFFFPEFNMTKTLNQIIFFSLHQNQNTFFSNIGNQIIFLEKKHNPHPFKLNGRFLMNFWQINMKSQKIPKRYSGRIDQTKKAKKEDKK